MNAATSWTLAIGITPVLIGWRDRPRVYFTASGCGTDRMRLGPLVACTAFQRPGLLARTAAAVDELSGFIAACALVRPTGIEGMKPKSVRKKLKQPSFAAKVDRDQIQRGIEDLGVDEGEHIQFVIDAMAERADELGLSAKQVSG